MYYRLIISKKLGCFKGISLSFFSNLRGATGDALRGVRAIIFGHLIALVWSLIFLVFFLILIFGIFGFLGCGGGLING